MNTPELCERVINLLFPFDEFEKEAIPTLALSLIECVPTFQAATQEQTEFIFRELCAALSDLQLARRMAKSQTVN